MGATLCIFGQDSPKRLPKQDYSVQERRSGLSASFFEFLKPQCLWTLSRRKKRQLMMQQQQEKQQQITLQEWILASPSSNNGFKQLSNRVHPSMSEENSYYHQAINTTTPRASSFSTPRGSFSMEDSLLMSRRNSTSSSGRTKKRVSFRLPEVADVFILDSPDV